MIVEMRYTEHNDRYYLSIFATEIDMDSHNDLLLSQRPAWLVAIADMARAGEHFLKVVEPPPDRVLWFSVDENFNLVDIDIFHDRHTLL
ncbi:MAG: hypothetical protein EHM17_14215 [Verrucomicrobiaceae bacterium]|nr:MAG: hypothetical protein EHM17_16105 [Verrucomicrobiaceae bacterium]RPJ32052.1 MAG: hypothetical protein EHM17_14215 [Verrucomicrobiaceae bacterium]